METLSVFSAAKQSLVKASGHRLLVSSESGILKVVDLRQRQNEAEILEVCENLSSFDIRHNLLAATTLDGSLQLFEIDQGYTSVTKKLEVFRSELGLRDVLFLDDTHIVCGGDDTKLVVCDLSIVFSVPDRYHLLEDVSIPVLKSDLPDQVRSLAYNSSQNHLAVSTALGDVIIMKYSSEDGLKPSDTLSKACGSFVHLSNDISDPNNIVRNTISFAGGKMALADEHNQVKVFTDYSQPSTHTYKDHAAPVVDLCFCGESLASVDFSRKLILRDTSGLVQSSLTLPEAPLNICSTKFDSTRVVVVGTASGDVFILERPELSEPAPAPDFREEYSDDDLFGSPVPEAVPQDEFDENLLKRTRALLEPDSDEELDPEPKLPQLTSVLPGYTLKPALCGSSPWKNNKRYLTICEYGNVTAQRDPAESSQTITVNLSSGKLYYFSDLQGFDLALLNEEGVLLASSAYIDKEADFFATSLGNVGGYRQARIHYRPHRSENESWTKVLPVKNYSKPKEGHTSEFITNINLARKNIFVFSSLGHVRVLTKYGLLVGLEKVMPVIASISNARILFTISCSQTGREFYYSIRDLLTSSRNDYIHNCELFPLDYLLQRLLEDTENWDHLLVKFEQFEQKSIISKEEDVGPGLDLEMARLLVFQCPYYALKGLFFSSLGDPCFVDNSNYVYVLTKWKSSSSNIVPILNLNETLVARPHLDYIPLGLVHDKLNIIFYLGEAYDYPIPLPEPTELSARLPVNLNVDMKAIKDMLRAQKEVEEAENFVADEDEDEELEESEDEDVGEEVRQQIQNEEAFLRARVLGDVLQESLDSHSHFERTFIRKLKAYRKTRAVLEEDGDYFLPDLDLAVSEDEFEEKDNEIRLKVGLVDVDGVMDRLEELNGQYDKTLLSMFTELCLGSEIERAKGLVRHMRQDRALIAASRIAERMELGELVGVISDERERRMD